MSVDPDRIERIIDEHEMVEQVEQVEQAQPVDQAEVAQPVEQAPLAEPAQQEQLVFEEDQLEYEKPPSEGSRFSWWRSDELVVRNRVPDLYVKGKVINNVVEDETTQTRYIAYRGIPYAAPPTQDSRFQPTQPLVINKVLKIVRWGTPGWVAPTWNAFEDKEPCLQRDVKDVTYGNEDCLYLDVYIPKEVQKIAGLLPVLVLFHGGDFIGSSGKRQEIMPDSIMKHDLVFVVVKYRTGPVGFLNMQTQSCRGNMGLKDQVQALLWIQNNIVDFRGNSTNVTIAGHGASATCVNFHLISPMSKGLFHKAIVMGGGIYCPYGFKGHRREFVELIKQAKNEQEQPRVEREEDTLEYKARKIVTEFFMQKSAEDFMKAAEDIMDDYNEDSPPTQLTVYLGPSVEIKGEHTFIGEPINDMMLKAQHAVSIPVLAGITKNEGNQIYMGYPTAKLVELVRQPEYFNAFLNQNFQWDNSNIEANMKWIKDNYFKGKGLSDPVPLGPTDREIEEGLVDMFTDICHRRFYDNFKFGPNQTCNKLYVYEFDYFSDLNKYRHQQLQNEFYRPADNVAGHGDELLYLFCPSDIRRKFKPFAKEVNDQIETMCKLWANFCRKEYQPPAPEWTNHTDAVSCYMHIGSSLTMKTGLMNEHRWRRLNELVGDSNINSLTETPVTPEPPTILSPNWCDPELTPSTDTWTPIYSYDKNSRRGSSTLSRISDSRKSSLVSGIWNAPSQMGPALERFLGYRPRYEQVPSSPMSSAGTSTRSPQTSPPGPSSRPRPVPLLTGNPPEPKKQGRRWGIFGGGKKSAPQQPLAASGSPGTSTRDSSVRGLIQEPTPKLKRSLWERAFKRGPPGPTDV